MNAMLDPRIVAARTQGPERPQGAEADLDRTIPSSQGGRTTLDTSAC
jgi:hypothetical protein